jgi:hypothetical protein
MMCVFAYDRSIILIVILDTDTSNLIQWSQIETTKSTLGHLKYQTNQNIQISLSSHLKWLAFLSITQFIIRREEFLIN